nr:MAG TPA: DNA binding protein like protein [Caudoviricetes sp.]
MAKGLIEQMKEKIAKSGSSKKDILYFGKDTQKRIRFLQELDEGYVFEFHNNWDPSIFELCKDPEDHENCKLCEEGISLQDQYVWSVWDYDSSSVKLIQFKATGLTPIPAFIEMYEEFGTILDRDYKVKKVGQGQGASYVVTPLDKERFKNSKAKPFTRKQVKEILENAWQPKEITTDEDDDDEEEEESKAKNSKDKKKNKKKQKSLRDKFEELSFKELKEIAMEIGISKKELKAFEDEEELLDELFDNYEEDDLEELLEDLDEEEEDED